MIDTIDAPVAAAPQREVADDGRRWLEQPGQRVCAQTRSPADHRSLGPRVCL